jgi:hypothetical protein
VSIEEALLVVGFQILMDHGWHRSYGHPCLFTLVLGFLESPTRREGLLEEFGHDIVGNLFGV